MSLFADVSVLSTLIKGTAALCFLAAGIACLWSSHVDRTPKLAAKREARRKPYVSPFSAPLPLQPAAPRLETGSALEKLSGVLDTANARVEQVHSATTTAARQIAGAESALNRLVEDVATVMPMARRPHIIPRRGGVAPATAPVADAAA